MISLHDSLYYFGENKMKSNQKIKVIILITLGIALALSPMFNNTIYFNARYGDENSEHGDTINLDDENVKTSKVSGPIFISGNSGWVDFRDDGNCTGSGTHSDPYVIEDLVIDGGLSGSCILIKDSNEYFIIRNCTLYGSGPDFDEDGGIKLEYVNNGKLIDNNCSSNGNGIFLEYSNHNTISGNTADYNYNGIRVEYSNHNTISGNTVNDVNVLFPLPSASANGIYLLFSDDNIVSGNTANNNHNGIWLLDSDDNTVSGNTANNNYYGICLVGSDFNTISGNSLMGNYDCIVELDCKGNEFKDNEYCDYGEGDGIPFELILLISIIGGGTVIGVGAILLIRSKRKRIQ